MLLCEPHQIAHLVEKFFWLAAAGEKSNMGVMFPLLTGGSVTDKRIIQNLSAFKGRFLGPNTR
jgi:hypothetical protein